MDSAAVRLLEDLSVTSDPRAYLLTVSYRAENPQLAELITNAFVAELLRSAKLQALFKQRSLAQATLSIQLAKFGDKHPNVAQAKLRLTATDELLKKQLDEDYGTILKAAGENVTKAVSGPISFKFVIVLLLLGGLVVGVGAALWLERDRWYAH
jgi:capsular polysaccharide biosynthesis protein